MSSKLENDKILEKVRGLDYESKIIFTNYMKIKILRLREDNDHAKIDEVPLNQGGIRELNAIIRELEYVEK